MLQDELIVDSFAGGGGASLGIEWATGRSPDIAINHNPAAIAMHAANHPNTRHYAEDVFAVSPKRVTRGKPVALLWLSPDCRHFSRAKGSKPVEKRIRGLAWIAVKWAVEKKPRVIILENVREFQEWGPVVPRWACRSCDWKGTEGQTVLLRRQPTCPRCESRKVNPTEDLIPCPKRKGLTFKKFVGRLRNLGYSVEWKVLNAADYGAPTHRRRLFLVARCDGAEIQWPAPTHGDPKKIHERDLFSEPLKPWRTAAECIDWSIPCPSIFERKKPLAEKTLKRIAMGIKRYVLDEPKPFVVHVTHAGERRVHPVDEPLSTVTSANRGELALVTPTIIRQFGKSTAASVEDPLGTTTAGGSGKTALVAAFLAKHFGDRGQRPGSELSEPLSTITATDHNALVAASMIHMNHGEKQWSPVGEPLRTVTSSNHAALVYSFLVKYFGTGVGQHVDWPLHTITGKDRFGLVTVMVGGEPYVITDIGMRMLKPRELARAQGFPDDYLLTGTATDQVARIGNSVSPYPAAALVEANLVECEVAS